MNCSRRAEGLAFLMVLRFREANRKIIFLGCDDNAPSKMNMVQPKNHPIETENHLSSTSVQARGNKDSRRNCLVPWRGVKGGWCAYRTFLLCSRFVICTYIRFRVFAELISNQVFLATFTGSIHGKTLSI